MQCSWARTKGPDRHCQTTEWTNKQTNKQTKQQTKQCILLKLTNKVLWNFIVVVLFFVSFFFFAWKFSPMMPKWIFIVAIWLLSFHCTCVSMQISTFAWEAFIQCIATNYNTFSTKPLKSDPFYICFSASAQFLLGNGHAQRICFLRYRWNVKLLHFYILKTEWAKQKKHCGNWVKTYDERVHTWFYRIVSRLACRKTTIKLKWPKFFCPMLLITYNINITHSEI